MDDGNYSRRRRELCFELLFKNLYITMKLCVKTKNNRFLIITNAFFFILNFIYAIFLNINNLDSINLDIDLCFF